MTATNEGVRDPKYYTVIVGKKEWTEYVHEGLHGLLSTRKMLKFKARGSNGAAKVGLICSFFVSEKYARSFTIKGEAIEREYEGEKSIVPEIEADLELNEWSPKG